MSLVSCNKAVDQGDKKSPMGEQKRQAKAEEKRKKQEAALPREEARRVREEAQRQQEREEKKAADLEALLEAVSKAAAAKLYDDLDQNDSLSEAHAAQRHTIIRNLAREFGQSQSGALEYDPVLIINTGPYAFEPSEVIYRSDVYSYDCLTREITFRDGTSGYYPEALADRDEK
jgi:hypothetical protein